MSDNAITTTKILDATIALADLEGNSVNSSKIVDGSVTGTDIASSTITSGNIASNAVSDAKLVSGTYTKISGLSVSNSNGLLINQGTSTGAALEFSGTSDTGGGKTITTGVDEAAAKAGAIRVKINGDYYWIRFYESPN